MYEIETRLLVVPFIETMEEEEYGVGITYTGHVKKWAPTLVLHAPSPPSISIQDGRLFYSPCSYLSDKRC